MKIMPFLSKANMFCLYDFNNEFELVFQTHVNALGIKKIIQHDYLTIDQKKFISDLHNVPFKNFIYIIN